MWNTVLLLLPFIMDFANAKYCAYEDGGDTRFYTCPHTEYCCNFGCCLSPTFQFYQLWYYWLLVIFMFLLCSGGGWWYRCWLRGRFPETQTSLSRSSAIPLGTLPHRRSTTVRSNPPSVQPLTEVTTAAPQNQFQVARVSYSTSGDRLVLHRVWKDNQPNNILGSPPSYSTARADSPSFTLPPGEAILMNPYVLYGPPPSYDSVMQQDQAGPSGTQVDSLLPGSGMETSTPSPIDEQESSTETCPSSSSPMTPPTPSPCTPQGQSFATSPVSPSDEDRAPEISHQASQTVSSPIVSPTNPNPL